MDREKLVNSPTWYAGETCVVCGSPYVEQHHVLYGVANRKKSEKRGYKIPVCRTHHCEIHRNRGMALRWMELAQMHYERNFGSRREFIQEFGKSYL